MFTAVPDSTLPGSDMHFFGGFGKSLPFYRRTMCQIKLDEEVVQVAKCYCKVMSLFVQFTVMVSMRINVICFPLQEVMCNFFKWSR